MTRDEIREQLCTLANNVILYFSEAEALLSDPDELPDERIQSVCESRSAKIDELSVGVVALIAELTTLIQHSSLFDKSRDSARIKRIGNEMLAALRLHSYQEWPEEVIWDEDIYRGKRPAGYRELPCRSFEHAKDLFLDAQKELAGMLLRASGIPESLGRENRLESREQQGDVERPRRVFRQVDGAWLLAYGETEHILRSTRGLHFIWKLLGSPRDPIPSHRLAPDSASNPGHGDERKRNSVVGISIDRALEKIEAKLPEMAAHLRSSIDTPHGGAVCYRPGQEIDWDLG